MSVVIETTLGDITVDLFLYERPRACLNFLKLCKIKYYNYNLFHTISRGFIAQTGDPTGTRNGGESIFAVIDGPSKKYFEAENEPRIKHTRPGLISFVGGENKMTASQFFLTLGDDLTYLDESHCVFGEVTEGFEILESINEVICDNDNRPFQDVRITHTIILDDPYPDPKGLKVPSRSPSPSAERLAGGRIAPDEKVDEMSGKSAREIAEMQAEREAKARAAILEMVGDIPDADMAPPENVLFVCKLNPVTNDDDLEIIFSRFGKIKSCEVIRDRKSGDSLQYAFIEFEDQKSCEDAYFKMDNVLVDDRRLHVDFSQSVSKVKWLGKGRGVTHFDDRGNKKHSDVNNDVGKGEYKIKNGSTKKNSDREKNRRQSRSPKQIIDKSRSPRRRKISMSPERSRRRSRSPQQKWRPNRSPVRKGRHSQTIIRRSESPVRRRQHNRSPDYSSRRNDRRYSPKRFPGMPKHSRGNFRRNVERYSPERKFDSFRQRSRSPWRSNRSPIRNERNNFTRRQNRSPSRKSRSPLQKSKSPAGMSSSPECRPPMSDVPNMLKNKQLSSSSTTKSDVQKTGRNEQQGPSRRSRSPRRLEKKLSEEKRDSSRSSKEQSESPRRTKNISSSKYTAQPSRKADGRKISKSQSEEMKKIGKSSSVNKDRNSKDNKDAKDRLSLESNITKEKAKKSNNFKNKKAKISKKYSSDTTSTDSEEDRRKSKKKKPKKKVESSSDTSSSEESSTSSEEVVKKKAKKRKSKRDQKNKKSKSSKKRKSSSSSSDSSSESESDSSTSSSSTSESERDSRKKKKSKKTRT